MWTIYDHPSDYPNEFVARLFEIRATGATATGHVVAAPTLPLIRRVVQRLAPGSVCVGRRPDDEPVVVETWL